MGGLRVRRPRRLAICFARSGGVPGGRGQQGWRPGDGGMCGTLARAGRFWSTLRVGWGPGGEAWTCARMGRLSSRVRGVGRAGREVGTVSRPAGVVRSALRAVDVAGPACAGGPVFVHTLGGPEEGSRSLNVCAPGWGDFRPGLAAWGGRGARLGRFRAQVVRCWSAVGAVDTAGPACAGGPVFVHALGGPGSGVERRGRWRARMGGLSPRPRGVDRAGREVWTNSSPDLPDTSRPRPQSDGRGAAVSPGRSRDSAPGASRTGLKRRPVGFRPPPRG